LKPIRIEAVRGRQILDSRGTPTVEAEILLDDGTAACASVPSGASTGRHEAVELRDGDRSAYQGRSVLKAVRSVNETLNSALKGRSAGEQAEIDDAIQRADGTENKAALGANATLAVSLACAKAAAAAHGLGLYRWLGWAVRTRSLCRFPC
jgi:phosphopyruvate hydratase